MPELRSDFGRDRDIEARAFVSTMTALAKKGLNFVPNILVA